MARLISFSTTPSAPTAPPSAPPWPGSTMTVRTVPGSVWTARRASIRAWSRPAAKKNAAIPSRITATAPNPSRRGPLRLTDLRKSSPSPKHW